MLEKEISKVNVSLVRMLSLTREASELAKHSLIKADLIAAEQCIKNDEQINALQDELEHAILVLIARHQPTATDLRFLGAAHWALVDIERAGDYAVHVAKAAIHLAKEPPLKKYTDTQRMFTIISSMIEKTITAFTESSLELAKEVYLMDKKVDDLDEQIKRELLTYMLENPKTITRAIELLRVVRYLERLADHIQNVSEHIIFWLTGKRFTNLKEID